MPEVLLRDPRGVVWRVEVAGGLRQRLTGLLGRSALAPGRALLLPGVRSVHTAWMRFPIHVALLDAELRVLRVRPLPPWRVTLPRPRVRHALEYAALEDGPRLQEGDLLVPTEAAAADLG